MIDTIMVRKIGMLCIAAGVGLVLCALSLADKPALPPQPANVRTLTLELPPLEEFIKTTMDACGGDKLSAARRVVVEEQILRHVRANLKGISQYGFISIPCLETRMGSVRSAISGKGARGIAQLMPATARAEAKARGMGDLTDSDLMDSELNLKLATLHYASLVERVGDEYAAAAYNSGEASQQVKEARALTPIKNNETAGYLSVVYVLLMKSIKAVEEKK